MTDPKQVVRSGYDEIANRYDKWASLFESPELAWVSELLSRLDRDADVLDLGCGGGRRPARTVAAAHRYTGVDLSTVQIELARRRIPSGRFIVADATQLELAPESFDAVMSLFVLGHIPRSEQARCSSACTAGSGRAAGCLRRWARGGSVGEVEDDWLGAPMFFASFDPDTNRGLVVRAGFELVQERVVAHDEPGHGPVSFMWLLARKP